MIVIVVYDDAFFIRVVVIEGPALEWCQFMLCNAPFN